MLKGLILLILVGSMLPVQAADVALFLSPDGSHLCRQSDAGFSLWEIATGKNKATWGPAPDKASQPVFRADGQELLTLSTTGMLRITQVSTGRPRLQLQVGGYKAFSRVGPRALTIHPQGRWLALSLDGQTNVLLPAQAGARPRPLSIMGDIETPDLMAYSPNAQWLAYAGTHLAYTVDDGEGNSVLQPAYSVYLRQAADGAMRAEVIQLAAAETLWEMLFSPRSDWLALTTDAGLYLWDTGSRSQRHFLPEAWGHTVFSPDGQRFATALRGEGYAHQIGIYDSQSGEQLHALPQNGDTLQSMAFAPDGKSLLIAESETVKVFDLQAGWVRSYQLFCQTSCRLNRVTLP
ncbi:MAG: WD40 repeat domain-containing protein [Candidatus Sericytochromatia bacterium]